MKHLPITVLLVLYCILASSADDPEKNDSETTEEEGVRNP